MAANSTRPSRVLLFGDECVDKLAAVEEIYDLSRSSLVLRSFLQQAITEVHHAVSELRREEQRSFGLSSNDILELAESYAAQKPLPPIVGDVLLFVVQIGHLILRAEQDGSILAQDNNRTIHLLGLCVGLPAACVAAAARNIPHAVGLATAALGVIVRFGAALHRRSQLIEAQSGAWGSTIVGSQEYVEQQLQEINESLPLVRHAYAGVISETWTTVFAPPSTTSLLASSVKTTSRPPYATASSVHASHLAPIDLAAVVGSHSAFEIPVLRDSIVSTSTMAPCKAHTFRELLTLALRDISEKPLLLDRTVQALSQALSGNERVTLIPVGPTAHTALVKRTLEKNHVDVQVLTADRPMSDRYKDNSPDRIAIVSMSGRFPGAENIEDFWQLLQAGKTMHSPIPPTRFAVSDPDLKKLSGCFLSNPGLFDPEFFKMSPSESMQVDPIQRMLLMVVYEALQMAGYVQNSSPSTQSERISTFIGQTTSDWLGINDQQGVGTHYVPGSLRAFAAGRLNHVFGWGGGSSSIDTALSHVIWAGPGFAETTRSAMHPVGHDKPYPPSDMELEAYIAEFRRWFTGRREDFGTNGWEAYVGDHNIGVSVVPQANHCTIVEQPQVKELGQILLQVLNKIAILEK
ncbi:hypothetical protein M409DRAFT_48629 [Zasmidium cellare ATCC 36951]|uniref:Ketosynthase family 3 (KS3) domain-containing protein n=1 Tax=Zasmidium cellare ATCC 36951 TaxID=1080233 RepID=A0A6A6D6A8_ZASCE|nr:uncharacterized protein M409DRAFT_48629 [Zasmidium cellare ATCC 36951]KAF2173689.1 hypothetical protein M409DRAFT_48629 [Zasmidium cellare ATCC 36951]